MRMQTLGAATLAAVVAMAAPAALAHGPQGGFGGPAQQGHCPMMGHGYGPMMGKGHGRMMGQGYGPMMGQGQGPMMGYGHRDGMGRGLDRPMGPGHRGQMGQGFDCLTGTCPRGYGQDGLLHEDLSADGVRHMMEHRVARSGNPNLKVGDVAETDDDTITAEVVTKDGSLVRRFLVDRHTGAMWPEDRMQPEGEEQ